MVVGGGASLGPALVGLGGTVVGGVLTVSVSIWNSRSVRKRELDMASRKFEQDEIIRCRGERQKVYVEWAGSFGRLMLAADEEPAEIRPMIMGMAKIADAIQIIGSTEVADAVRAELLSLRRIEVRIIDRQEMLGRAQRLHDATLAAMRGDMRIG
jgi:xanthine/CO dehydrogenase XdhC/CoxF family maturation factor